MWTACTSYTSAALIPTRNSNYFCLGHCVKSFGCRSSALFPQVSSRRTRPSCSAVNTDASTRAPSNPDLLEKPQLYELQQIFSTSREPQIVGQRNSEGAVLSATPWRPDGKIHAPAPEDSPHRVTCRTEGLRLKAPTRAGRRSGGSTRSSRSQLLTQRGRICHYTGTALHAPTARLGAGGRPWTTLHAKLQHSLLTSKLLDSHSVLVAVSGGQDSVCLLQALVDLQPLWNWRLGVIHCDHGWRTDSAANADFVKEMAEGRFGLPYYVRTAAPGTVPSEHSAREWRYRVFTEMAVTYGYDVVVTGHTATDRAETMLLNLLRGAGPDGLVALARSRPLVPPLPTSLPLQQAPGSSDLCDHQHGGFEMSTPSYGEDDQIIYSDKTARVDVHVARPLLEFSRSETREFVELLGLPYFHDTTNDCNDLRRNRLRNEVMPALRLNFNPRLDQALFRFVEVLSAEMEYLEHVTDELYDTVVSHDYQLAVQEPVGDHSTQGCGNGERIVQRGSMEAKACQATRNSSGSSMTSGLLKLDEVRRLPVAMQRRVVRKWLEVAMRITSRSGPSRGDSGSAPGAVRYDDVARCLALLDAPNRSNSDSLCGGMVASVRNGHLVLLTPGGSGAKPAHGSTRDRQQKQ